MSPVSGNERLGRGFLWVAALAVLGGLTLLFNGALRNDGGIVSSGMDGGRAMVVLKQDRSGHYVAEGLVNGRPVVFLGDTGATDVAMLPFRS